jgi:hypothetical protein
LTTLKAKKAKTFFATDLLDSWDFNQIFSSYLNASHASVADDSLG